jgi:hypothetical protein
MTSVHIYFKLPPSFFKREATTRIKVLTPMPTQNYKAPGAFAQQNPCSYGVSWCQCSNPAKCLYTQPKRNPNPCRYGVACRNRNAAACRYTPACRNPAKCLYTHPCRYGAACSNRAACRYTHPCRYGAVCRNPAKCLYTHPCRYGAACSNRTACRYTHPRAQQHMKNKGVRRAVCLCDPKIHQSCPMHPFGRK